MSIRSKKTTLATAGASLALVAALLGAGAAVPSAAAWAAQGAPLLEQARQASPTPSTRPEGQRPGRGPGQPGNQPGNPQQRQQHHDAYLNALAGRLGLSVDQLKAAMQQSHIDLINLAVAEGRITQEQANRRIQAIQSGQFPGPMGPRGPHGPGGPGMQRPGGPGGPGMQRPGGPAGVRQGAGQELAAILGITPEELRAEFQSGKSLAQIGEAKGISRETLKAKLTEAHKARIDAAVAAGRLTAEQAQQMTQRFTANVDQLLDRTPGQRPGRPGPGRTT